MKSELLLLAFLVSCKATSYNCFNWKCADSPNSPQKCANYFYDTIEFSRCRGQRSFELYSCTYAEQPEGFIEHLCSYRLTDKQIENLESEYSISLYAKTGKRFLNPGQRCAIKHECFSQKCLNGTCIAPSGPGDGCGAHTDCPLRYYCSQEVCTHLHQLNEACPSGEGCDFGLKCISGVCQEKFKTPNYDIAEDIDNCKSGFMVGSVCVPAFVGTRQSPQDQVNIIPAPYTCEIGQTCVYLYKGDRFNTTLSEIQYFQTPCQCNGQLGLKGRCPIARGMAEYQDFLSTLLNVQMRVKYDCHYSEPWENYGGCSDIEHVKTIFAAQNKYANEELNRCKWEGRFDRSGAIFFEIAWSLIVGLLVIELMTN